MVKEDRRNGERKDRNKGFFRYLIDGLIDVFAEFIYHFLIWTGAVLALVSSDEPILAIILIIAGAAYLYKNDGEDDGS